MSQYNTITSYTFFRQLTALPFVEAIWLFGSRAIGDATERSDIDLAIICPKATPKDWQCILDIVDEADTLHHIDCVRFDTLSSENPLRQAIIKQHIILFGQENGT